MTIVFEEQIVKGSGDEYLVYIEQEKYSSAYKVGICDSFGNGFASYPFDERYYGDMQKAKRRYKDLIKRAERGDWG